MRTVPANPSRTLFASPLVSVGVFRCAPDHENFRRAGAIARHCFVFPRRGVWIRHEGEGVFVADPTRMTFYNPEQPYERTALDPDGDRSDWIEVSAELARDAVRRIDPCAAADETRVFRWAYAAAPSRLYLRQRLFFEFLRANPSADPMRVEEGAIALLTHAIAGLYATHGRPQRRASETRAAATRRRELAEAACAHLNRTFARDDILPDIARALGTSVFHLCRVFRAETGLSLHAYRTRLRLRHALERLRSEKDLLTLALDVGYSGHSHFTSTFRKQFGVSPSDVRERLSGGWRAEAGG